MFYDWLEEKIHELEDEQNKINVKAKEEEQAKIEKLKNKYFEEAKG